MGLDQKSEYARKANRRLFLLSTIYARDKKLKKQSKAFAKKIKDEKFIIQSEKMQRAIDYNKIEKIKADKTTIKTIEFIREQSDSNFTVPELTKYVERIHKKLKSEKFSDSKKDDIKENRKKQERIRARIKKVSLTKKMTKKEKKKIFRNLEKVDKLFLKDGNIFIGLVLKEDKQALVLATVMGIVRIPVSEIIKRKILSGEKSFK